jgi:Tfp pilus assembly protein PilW
MTCLKIRSQKNKGFSIIEIIIYISIFSLVVLASSQVIVNIFTSYKDVVYKKSIENSAVVVLDRITRETRSAKFIDSSSMIGNTNSSLYLTLEDDDGEYTLRFYKDGDRIYVQERNGEVVPLSSNKTRVDSFFVQQIDTALSTALRFTLTLSSIRGDMTKDFNTASIIQASY